MGRLDASTFTREVYNAEQVILVGKIEIVHKPDRGSQVYALYIDGVEQRGVSSFGFYLEPGCIPRYTIERLLLDEKPTTT